MRWAGRSALVLGLVAACGGKVTDSGEGPAAGGSAVAPPGGTATSGGVPTTPTGGSPTTGGVAATTGGAFTAGGSAETGGMGTGGSCPLSQEFCGTTCVDLRVDNVNCGACGRACVNPAVCRAGVCAISPCSTGYADCDGDPDGTCETNTLSDPANCGRCGTVCSSQHGTPSCAAGLCSIVCDAGYADCDRDLANGCEVALDSEPKHCGVCGMVCPTRCVAGVCDLPCAAGFADCDGNAANGCETNVSSDAHHCGGCGRVCPTPIACAQGVCQVKGPPPEGGPPPSCTPPWLSRKLSVLVLHDAHVTGGYTGGGMWVGGNLTGVGYDVGADLPPDPACLRYDLAVGGDINLSGYLVLHYGLAAFGGHMSGAGVTAGGKWCGIVHAPGDMPNFAELDAEVKSNSAYFASLPATGAVNGTTLEGASSQCKILVFNTALCTFDWSVTINLPADGTAIVNSACTSVTFSSEPTIKLGGVTQPRCDALAGTGGACGRVLYNFPNAATVTAGGGIVQGSILAPYAKFTGNGGAVAGEVVVDSMDTGIEFRAWFFEGCLDTTAC